MVMSTKDTKPRGYAFIEYEHEKDMHCKYPDLIRAVLYMVYYQILKVIVSKSKVVLF